MAAKQVETLGPLYTIPARAAFSGCVAGSGTALSFLGHYISPTAAGLSMGTVALVDSLANEGFLRVKENPKYAETADRILQSRVGSMGMLLGSYAVGSFAGSTVAQLVGYDDFGMGSAILSIGAFWGTYLGAKLVAKGVIATRHEQEIKAKLEKILNGRSEEMVMAEASGCSSRDD